MSSTFPWVIPSTTDVTTSLATSGIPFEHYEYSIGFHVLELVPANCTESLIYKKKLHLTLVKLWTTFYILFETLSGLRNELQTPLTSFKTLQARIRTNRNPNTYKA